MFGGSKADKTNWNIATFKILINGISISIDYKVTVYVELPVLIYMYL